MKTDRAEATAITDVVKRIAIAFPHVRFSLAGTDRTPLELPATGTGAEATLERIGQILGKEFSENALHIDAERDGIRLAGFAGIPSFNRGNALHQFAYVNGRPVRDKQIFGRCAVLIPMSSHATAIRWQFSSSPLILPLSMSMCIPPKQTCDSAIRVWCAALS